MTVSRLRVAAADRWILPSLVALVTFMAFLPALRAEFLDWDDLENFVFNPYYRGLGWRELGWMWTAVHMGHYIPLTWMTLGLDYVIWGMDPTGYHLTNLLLHAANGVIFYLVALRLLKVVAPGRTPEDVRGLRVAAAFGALTFAVHPLRVESVAWATERRDVLSGLFSLLTTLAYLRAAAAPMATLPFRRGWYWVSVGCFAAAVLSKSMAVTLPAILVILDFYPLRRFADGPSSWFAPAVRRHWVEKVPYVLISAVGSAIAMAVNRDYLKSVPEFGVLDRLAVFVQRLAFYLWKTIAPVQLVPMYEFESPVSRGSCTFLLSVLVVTGVTAAAVVGHRRWPAVGTAWLASVILLGPVSGILHNEGQVAADRYTYLPALPWAILGVAGFWLGWRARPRWASLSRALLLTGGLGVVVVLGVLTFIQTETWHDSERLWTHAHAIAPSSVSYNNLGVHSARQGRLEEAAAHFRAAVRINPDFADAHTNLGIVLARQGLWEEAGVHSVAALRIRAGEKGRSNPIAAIRLDPPIPPGRVRDTSR